MSACSGLNKLSLRTTLGWACAYELEYCQMERGHTRCLVDGGLAG